jgi:DNA helicase HerA-like ATPase
MSELFENLPEVGDPEKPKLVVFFDEAHLMFKNTPRSLIDKIEQVVRLIRSKGVGIYFISQSPGDIPDSVLGQLGNRVQHALRAFTPREQKAVKTAAQTFRSDKSFSVQDAIGEMGVGEALVSTLMANGSPSFVKRALVKPPVSRIGAARKAEISAVMMESPHGDKYDTAVDRESAFEKLASRAEAAARAAAEKKPPRKRTPAAPKPRGRPRQGLVETFAKSVVRSLGGRAGRALVRGILGSLFKGR